MPDYFVSPQLLLTRAKKDIAEFEAEWKRFVNEKPWTFVADENPNGLLKEFKVRFNRPFPDIFSELSGRAIWNLRAVLDQSGYASALASGIANPKKTAFPFGDSAEGLEDVIKRGSCKHLHPDIVALMCGFKPYPTPNRTPILWAINRIANVGKHAVVTPIAMFPKFISFGGIDTIPELIAATHSRWNPMNNEIVYAPLSEVSAKHHVYFSVDIALGEIEGIGVKPALFLLNGMASKVESVLMAIEAETRRLFPGAF